MGPLMCMVSPSRYVQGEGALKRLGPFIRPLGDNAVVIGGERALSLVVSPMRESLENEKIGVHVLHFGGECTYKEIARLKKEAKPSCPNVIIGAGGGKALDAAKLLGHELKCALALIPTIASSDAPTTSIAVVHTERHAHEKSERLGRNPDLVLVDTELVARAPARFLVSGMGDALATRFEAEACFHSSGVNSVGYRPTLAALALARTCYDTLIAYGLRAKWSAERHLVTPALDKIVEANILLSGFGVDSGGLAAAHAIQMAFDSTEQAMKSLHGEKVAMATLAQLFMEDREESLISEVGQFFLSVGLPVCLEDVFVETSELPSVGESACQSAMMKNMGFPVSPRLVRDCLILADSFGRHLKRNPAPHPRPTSS